MKKKLFFDVFRERSRGGVSDIFVERIKLYHNPKVQDNCIFFYEDADFERKIPQGSGKKVVPNSVAQLFLSLIMTFQSFFVPNYDGNCIFSPALEQSIISMTILHYNSTDCLCYRKFVGPSLISIGSRK